MTLNRTWQRMRSALSPSPRHPRRALMEQLEQRVLLSAEIDVPVVAPLPEALATTANVYPPESAGSSVAATSIRHEIVFVDTRTPDYQQLVDDLIGQQDDPARQFELVLLDGSQDGVERITEVLSTHQDLSAIHLIAHGGDGTLQLGTTTLDASYLQEHGDQLAAWSAALDSDADILIYGCDVAATGHGRAFVDALSRLTGADVAASTDATGSDALGGNWTLEQSVGHIETSIAVSMPAQSQWQGLLTLVAYDDFPHNGNLNNDNGGSGWADAWTADNSKIKVNGGGLSEPNGLMADSGDSAILDMSGVLSTTWATRNLATTMGADGTTTWISFLLQPDVVSGVNYMGVEFGGGSGTVQFAGYNGSDFIIDNAGGTGIVTVPGITPVSGQTYLMVVRVEHAAGNDTVTLFVDPTPGKDAPDSTFTVSKTVDVGSFTRIAIAGGQVLATNQAQVDALRIGTTYRDVANSLVVTTSADDNDSGIVDGNVSHDIQWLIANPGGDGVISLREAMIAANNTTGADTITFNIPGSTAHTITLHSALPAVRDSVTIDGSSQPGYVDNGSMPVVVIDGNNGAMDGLRIENTADGSTINGLVLRNVRGNEIVVTIGADNNTITNNFIGSLGTDGNYHADGTATTGYGMWVNGADNLIANNVFAGNYRAIMIDGATASGTRIQGNKIGTNAAGTTGIGHGGGGIVVQNGASGVVIGTDLDGSNDDNEGNLIAYNSAAAISISNSSSNAVQILGNRIFGNSGLGIDLKDDSTSNANDAGDADVGPNGMLNHPVIYAAVVSGGNVTITGEARPSAVVEFFIADAAAGAYGEGQSFIGRGTVGASGTAGDNDNSAVFFSFTFAAGTMSVGDRITATATDSGATSEFSQNVTSTSTNAAPTISSIANQTIDEDGSTGAIAFTIDDAETVLAGLSIAASSANQTIIPNASITLGGSGANRTITVTPAANQNGGPVTITVEVSDGTNTTQRTFTVTVDSVNDPPVPLDDSYTTNEGTSLYVPQATGLLANDTDVEGNSPLVLTLTQPSNGTLTMGSNGSFTYTPDSGFSGTDSFEYLLRETGDGTTHYWGMGGNLTDSVGSSNGTTHGTSTTSGVFGSALGFDGTTSYGTLPDLSYSNDFTLSFWFKTPSNAGTGYQYLYAHDTPGTANSLAVYFIQDSTITDTGAQDVLRTRIVDSNDSDDATGLDLDVGALGLADNNWHLYTLTVANGVGSTVYIDGVAQASISNGGNSLNPTGSVMLGALTAGDTSRMFTGALDSMQMFGNALDANAVSALHDSPNRVGTVTIRVNDVPTVTTNTGMSLLQGQTKAITSAMLQVSDSDNTTSELTYTVSSSVSHGRLELSTVPGVSITTFTQADVDAGIVRYVHDNTATASDSFTFTVSDGDGGTTASTTFSLTISASNQAPAFTSTAVTAATEDSAYGYSITTSDADAGDTLTITAPTLPAWLTLTDNGDGTATLSGTPANGVVGSHAVVLQVSDGIATTTQSFTITVGNSNDQPTVANAIPNQSATEDAAFSFQFASNTFADVDAGDTLTYSASGVPAWLSFDAATRTFSGTPANADVGTVTITVRATDGSGAFVEDQFDLVVANSNDQPTVANAIPNQSATEDAAFSFQFASNTFADVDAGDTLTYSASGVPAWLSFDAATRTFSGTPANADVGTVTITVRATDGSGTFVEDQFDLVVTNSNDQPTVANAIPDQSATEDAAFSFQFAANTFADVDAGDALTYSASGVPAWLNFNAATRTFSGTPADADVGTVTITVRATDGSGAFVEDQFDLVVADTNNAPAFTSTAVTAATEDSSYTYSITTSDADAGDTLTITAPTLPAWLTLTDNGDGTATLTGTPTNAEVGTHSVVLQVSDGNVSVTQSFTITVSNVNDAPAFTSTPVTTVNEDSAYTYGITTSDVDAGDTRAITATTLPSWLTLTDNGDGTATLTGTPTNAAVGAHTVVLQVTDGDATVTQTFTVTVVNINDAPTLTAFSNQAIVEDGSTSALAFTIADVDSAIGTLTVTASSSDTARIPTAGIAIGGSGANRTLTVTPAANAAGGPVTIMVTVSDGSLSNATTFLVTITPVNDTPVLQHAEVVRVEQDGSTVVDATLLQVTDIDSAAASLRFTITAVPVEGSLLRNGVPLGLGDSFTQADINAGLITYAHRGGATQGIDVVELSVSDGAGGTLPVVSLLMDVTTPTPPNTETPAAGGSPDTGSGSTNDGSDSGSSTDNAVDDPTEDGSTAAPETDGEATTQVTSTTRTTADAVSDGGRQGADDLGRRVSTDADRGARRGGGGGVARLPFQGAIIQQEIAPASAPSSMAADAGSETNVYRAALSALPFRNSLDEVREQFKDRQGEERNVVASSIAMSTGVSIGYVIWLLRGGVLIGSVLSSLPAWRLLDPTPVLSGALARAAVDDEEDDSLEEMLRRAAERADRADQYDQADARQNTTQPEQQSAAVAADNPGNPETPR